MTVTLRHGHVVDALRSLPERSVHCVVTSPPYGGGLRKYGTAPQTWGGSVACDHKWGTVRIERRRGQEAGDTARVGNTKRKVAPTDAELGQDCLRCGAWRGELGSEQVPDCLAWARGEPPCSRCYVCHLRTVCGGKDRPEGVWRVLRDDGTLWLNEGDAFAANRSYQVADSKWTDVGNSAPSHVPDGLKAGDVLLLPERIALALQADGWLVRQKCFWVKVAPMPESLRGTHWEPHTVRTAGPDHAKWEAALAAEMERTGGNRVLASANTRLVRDKERWKVWEVAPCPGCAKCDPHGGLVLRWEMGRPTSAVEHVWLCAKSERYFYDLEATRVAVAASSRVRLSQNVTAQAGSNQAAGGAKTNGPIRAAGDAETGRNLWNWWALAPEGSSEDHYAMFPSELPRLCITAGTSAKGVCPHCGAPWAPVVERQRMEIDRTDWGANAGTRTAPSGTMVPAPSSRVVDWRPTCACPPHEPIPAVVLDPFNGSGTTTLVADRLGRSAIGIDLNPNYIALGEQRVRRDAPLFAQVEIA